MFDAANVGADQADEQSKEKTKRATQTLKS